ncbi:hypothetical protein [Burkholderia latens]|uniref:hypothetical protein n=1 Tax=Burkholderia latens TaxID=488446 RepID=UPI00158E14BD|nr:hypothetical protein [Burkholderia latens]
MVKTLAACAALCIAAVALARLHDPAARRPVPAHALAADTERVAARDAAGTEPVAEPRAAPSSNDANAGPQTAAAQGAGKPPIVALGVANAGWSELFNH